MQIRSVHAVLPASLGEAFAFLGQLDNLPRWATGFIRGDFRADGDVATAETAHGRATLRVRRDRKTGVIDYLVDFTQGGAAVFPSRVLPVGDRHAVYVFTAIQGPDQPDESFERDLASLERELALLPRLFEADHVVAR